MSEVMVTTMNDLPGHKVTEVFGEVFGLTVRSRNIGADIGASLKGLVGGEVKGYTKMLADSRLQAVVATMPVLAAIIAAAWISLRPQACLRARDAE